MSIITEEWRPVVGSETTHEVSNLGRVKSLPYGMKHWCGRLIPMPEKILQDSSHPGGYRTISIRGRKRQYVHRLVMAAFVGPGDGMDVNHIDGDKTNNALSNLEYCDRLHNVRHAIRTGLQNNAGENNGCCKYTDDQVRRAVGLVVAGDSIATASACSGVSEGMIQQVLGGVRRQYLGLADKELLAARSQGRGQRHPRASFTEQQVRDIRSSDERTYILASRYGVSQQCIASIRSGRTWKHLLPQEAVA
jgi:hypothetical protein